MLVTHQEPVATIRPFHPNNALQRFQSHIDCGPIPGTVRAILTGAVCGLGWGLLARLWMRFLADKPSFSLWLTGYIMAAATIAGACTGMNFAARRGHWRRLSIVRWLGFLGFLPLGFGAGFTIFLASIGISTFLTKKHWSAGWRLLFGFLGMAGIILAALIFAEEHMTLRKGFIVVPCFYGLLVTMTAAISSFLVPVKTQEACSQKMENRIAA